jgi:NTP pyrophosphatase (non-canonical NTP hydrolase)
VNNEEYIINVLKTESNDYEKIKHRIATRRLVRLLHGAMGLSTEANELLDALKKTIFYGKELDEVNIKEEIGDCLWYIALVLDEIKSSFEEVQEININKLFARYGISFNEAGAIKRDLSAERYVLEKDFINRDDICDVAKEALDELHGQ